MYMWCGVVCCVGMQICKQMSAIPNQQRKRLAAITNQLVDVKSAPVATVSAPAPAPAQSLSVETTAAIGKPGTKKDDDIVIVASVRTAIGRARRGGLKDTFIEEQLAAVLKGVLSKTNGAVKPGMVGDIAVGCVLGQNGQRANEARIAAFMAGFPETVPIHTLNRQCSSGLQAIAEVAAAIRAGYYDIGIGAGMESMSLASGKWDGAVNPKIFLNQQAKACLLPMGITSENVAAKYKMGRVEQEAMAVVSHARAAAAQKAGRFKEEIVPVMTRVKDEKTGAVKEVAFTEDDGIRADTTAAGLAKLPPAFDKNGTTTAGTASQVSDGAAATLLMTRAKAKSLGLPIIGVFRSFAVTGVPPEVMGIGPATAIPAALKIAGLQVSDIGLFELNEAFASQAVMCCKTLKLDMEKVNVNGGAMALGHPLGCTGMCYVYYSVLWSVVRYPLCVGGADRHRMCVMMMWCEFAGARLTATLLHEMGRRNTQYGVVSMCIGSGMGAAAVFEREY